MTEEVLHLYETSILGQQESENSFVDWARFTDGLIPQALKNVAFHHIESFNFAMGEALQWAINYLQPLELIVPEDIRTKVGFNKMTVWFESLSIEKPSWEGNAFASAENLKLFPTECRESGISYTSPLFA